MDILVIAAAIFGLANFFNRLNTSHPVFSVQTYHDTSPATANPSTSLPAVTHNKSPSPLVFESTCPRRHDTPPVTTHNKPSSSNVYSSNWLRRINSSTLPAPDPSVLSRLAHYGIYKQPASRAPRRKRPRKTRRGTRGGKNRRIHIITDNRPIPDQESCDSMINGPDFSNLIKINCDEILIED